jgi:hypothetical protein
MNMEILFGVSYFAGVPLFGVFVTVPARRPSGDFHPDML